MPQELPKLSGITKRLVAPEAQFEGMVKKATGIELPPGPQSVLLKLQQGFEAGEVPKIEEVIPKAPKLEQILAKLPELPPLEQILPGGKKGYELAKEEPKKAGYVMSR